VTEGKVPHPLPYSLNFVHSLTAHDFPYSNVFALPSIPTTKTILPPPHPTPHSSTAAPAVVVVVVAVVLVVDLPHPPHNLIPPNLNRNNRHLPPCYHSPHHLDRPHHHHHSPLPYDRYHSSNLWYSYSSPPPLNPDFGFVVLVSGYVAHYHSTLILVTDRSFLRHHHFLRILLVPPHNLWRRRRPPILRLIPGLIHLSLRGHRLVRYRLRLIWLDDVVAVVFVGWYGVGDP